MIKESTKKLISISKKTIQKAGGVVILPLAEYEELRRNVVPTYYLKGKEAEQLDSLVREGLSEYKAGKTKVIDSSKEYEYKIEYDVDHETKQVIATIPELNHVSSFGKTFAEAEANVKEAALCYAGALSKERKEVPQSSFKTEGTYLKLFVSGI